MELEKSTAFALPVSHLEAYLVQERRHLTQRPLLGGLLQLRVGKPAQQQQGENDQRCRQQDKLVLQVQTHPPPSSITATAG
jgi:hypothetical protein